MTEIGQGHTMHKAFEIDFKGQQNHIFVLKI